MLVRSMHTRALSPQRTRGLTTLYLKSINKFFSLTVVLLEHNNRLKMDDFSDNFDTLFCTRSTQTRY